MKYSKNVVIFCLVLWFLHLTMALINEGNICYVVFEIFIKQIHKFNIFLPLLFLEQSDDI